MPGRPAAAVMTVRSCPRRPVRNAIGGRASSFGGGHLPLEVIAQLGVLTGDHRPEPVQSSEAGQDVAGPRRSEADQERLDAGQRGRVHAERINASAFHREDEVDAVPERRRQRIGEKDRLCPYRWIAEADVGLKRSGSTPLGKYMGLNFYLERPAQSPRLHRLSRRARKHLLAVRFSQFVILRFAAMTCGGSLAAVSGTLSGHRRWTESVCRPGRKHQNPLPSPRSS
jgi:hypothetical protein